MNTYWKKTRKKIKIYILIIARIIRSHIMVIDADPIKEIYLIEFRPSVAKFYL